MVPLAQVATGIRIERRIGVLAYANSIRYRSQGATNNLSVHVQALVGNRSVGLVGVFRFRVLQPLPACWGTVQVAVVPAGGRRERDVIFNSTCSVQRGTPHFHTTVHIQAFNRRYDRVHTHKTSSRRNKHLGHGSGIHGANVEVIIATGLGTQEVGGGCRIPVTGKHPRGACRTPAHPIIGCSGNAFIIEKTALVLGKQRGVHNGKCIGRIIGLVHPEALVRCGQPNDGGALCSRHAGYEHTALTRSGQARNINIEQCPCGRRSPGCIDARVLGACLWQEGSDEGGSE